MSNPTNLLHGGIQCGMLDKAIGMTAVILGYGEFPISMDFHIDYLRRVKVGEKVKVIRNIISEGQNIIHETVNIYDMKDNKVSSSTSKLFKIHLTPIYNKKTNKIVK